MTMDAFSASLMADKREIIFAPTVYKFQTVRDILVRNLVDVIDVLKSSAFGVVRWKLLQIHIPFVDQFMQSSTDCRFALLADLHQSCDGIVPVIRQTEYF